ncbi:MULTISPECIES: 4Fe-4S dicluster domain-containing protein [Clostridium]|uniref:NAD(P)H-quinone oxidoreductase subunit I n=2 Tax=Clostridium TaxID=1485 RepID=A0A151ARF3_9CLOT|nr:MULTISPECIES: 4Fe-4S dicluster domain-containing protein [Clostridium]KYH30224.1 NAD(P)H-quinone oxidoreductase subunit I [Clostridium colicanis DSM 13634]MBE6044546.1 4Fe-4S ferredoxin [Clostridium thermopalmarium]PRR76721.1 NAD(P)H-quinone oxidoreductase subunit I [Clostridium thermopalmarium DSM 5974]PVZ23056.1 4Fe-4S binding protein [Clostridium thermopalmarium DSM 5974]
MSILTITKTLFKSVFHGPYIKNYSLDKKDAFKNTRGKIEINISQCIFCGLCQRRCPTEAIKVEREKSFWTIDRFKCIQCNYCCEACPKKCLHMENQYTAPSLEAVRDEYTNA